MRIMTKTEREEREDNDIINVRTIFDKANTLNGIDLRTLTDDSLRELLKDKQLLETREGLKLRRIANSLVSSNEAIASRRHPGLKQSLTDVSKWIFKLPLPPINANE